MTEEAPTVSVIMTTYNASKYVGEAIESILHQSFRDWELIIVDDGSTDSTRNIVGAYQDPRIRFEPRPHKGRAKALNEAVSLARGRYVANMDADDVALPYRLELEVDFLRKNKDYGLVGTAKPILFNGPGKVTKMLSRPESDSELRRALKTYNPFFHSAVMYRREAWRAVGGYNEEIPCLIDYEFWIRIASRYKVRNLPVPLAKKRIHSEQYFASRVYGSPAHMRARARVLLTYYRFIENDPRLLLRAWYYGLPLVPILYSRYIRPTFTVLFRQARKG